MVDTEEIDYGEIHNRLFGMLDYLGYSEFLKKKHPRQSMFGFSDMFSATTLAFGATPEPSPISRFVMDTMLVYEPPIDHLDPQGGLYRTQDFHKVPLENFVWYCAKIIEGSTLVLNRAIPFLPLRGALTYGPSILGKVSAYVNGADATDIAVGPTVIDAYKWEREQNWIGMSIEPNSIVLLEKDRPNELENVLSMKLLIPWDIPTKSGLIHTYAVNFVQENKCDRLLETFIDLREKSTHPAISAKYYASQKFVEYIRDNKLFSVQLKR